MTYKMDFRRLFSKAVLSKALLLMTVMVGLMTWAQLKVVKFPFSNTACSTIIQRHALSQQRQQQQHGQGSSVEREKRAHVDERLVQQIYPEKDVNRIEKELVQVFRGLPPVKNTDTACWKQFPHLPCVDASCQDKTPDDPVAGYRKLRSRQQRVDPEMLEVVARMAAKIKGSADVVIVTGSSENHFLESQGLIKSLHQHVFPQLRASNKTFHCFYYDLGLNPSQRALLEKYGQCDVMDFPFLELPPFFRCLKCYVFKPVIVQAHYPFARETFIWADASVRFTGLDWGQTFSHVAKGGVSMMTNGYSLGQLVALPMLEYFGEEPCRLSAYQELQAVYLVLKQADWVQSAVLNPWLSCAFSKNCMCPQSFREFHSTFCFQWRRQYGQCHRFDQAAMNVILLQLFGQRSSSFITPGRMLRVARDEPVLYFPQE